MLESDHRVIFEMKSSSAGSNFSSTDLCKCFNAHAKIDIAIAMYMVREGTYMTFILVGLQT